MPNRFFTDEELQDAPLSYEALEWITEATRRATNHTLRRYRNGAIIAFLFLFAGSVGERVISSHDSTESRQAIVQSGSAIAVDGCNRDYRTIKQLRGVLMQSRNFQAAALKRGDITQEQFARAQDYFNEQIDRLPLPDCRDASEILTANPDEAPDVPTALYPPGT